MIPGPLLLDINNDDDRGDKTRPPEQIRLSNMMAAVIIDNHGETSECFDKTFLARFLHRRLDHFGQKYKCNKAQNKPLFLAMLPRQYSHNREIIMDLEMQRERNTTRRVYNNNSLGHGHDN